MFEITSPIFELVDDEVVRVGEEKLYLQKPTCRNCRFWNMSNICNHPKNIYRPGNEPFAVAMTPELFCLTIAQADFGCIHFEINGLSIDEVDGLLKGLDGVPSIIGTKGA